MSYSQTEADLLRENAELAASKARLREALRKRVAAKVKKCKCKDCDELRNILAETPSESLAAIRDAAKRETVELLHSCQKEREQLAERLTAAEEGLDAARAEEREKLLNELEVIADMELERAERKMNDWWSARANAVQETLFKLRNRDNGGEAKLHAPKVQSGTCRCGHLRMEHEPDCLFCDCKAYEFVASQGNGGGGVK